MRSRGITMLVVLGSIILFTLLGFAALSLAKSDTNISGDLVKIKSQRIAAQAGFNLATARFQKDPLNAVAIFNAFLKDPTHNCWLDFDDASSLVKSGAEAPKWWSLNDGEASIRVKLLGVSAATDNDGFKIYLESYGKGKDGI